MNFLRFKFFIRSLIIVFCSIFLSISSFAERIKDVAGVAGVRSNQLVGFGLVTGLTGTGDGDINLTKQALRSVISRFGIQANLDDIDAKKYSCGNHYSGTSTFHKTGANYRRCRLCTRARRVSKRWHFADVSVERC